MKKHLVIFLTLILFAVSAAAIYNPNGTLPPPNCTEAGCAEIKMLDGPPESNQSNISVELERTGSSCAANESVNSVTWGNYSKLESMPPRHQLEFNGTVYASNPCQDLEYNVTRKGGVYTLNVQTVRQEGPCQMCLGAVSYTAEVDAQTDYFQLTVQHDGETVDMYAPPQKINEGGPAEKPGNDTDREKPREDFLSGLTYWFRSLF